MSFLNQKILPNHLQEQNQNEFQDIFLLQEIYLAHEITKELEERELNVHGLAQKFIELCKESEGEDQFVHKTEKVVGSTVSKHFLSSLYTTIRQKLPRMIEILEENLQEINEKEEDQFKREGNNEQIKDQKVDEEKRAAEFPGLSIPNKDEIQLDLDLDGDGDGEPPKAPEQEIERKEVKRFSPEKKEYEERQERQEREKRHEREEREERQERRKHKKDKKKKRKYSRERSYSREQRRSKERSRSRHKKKQRKRSYSPENEPLEQGRVYKGKITSLLVSGCIVKLYGTDDKRRGVLHSEQLEQRHANYLKEGYKVWVKVLAILEDRVRLTMKNIDQRNGYDYNRSKGGHEQQRQRKQNKDYGSLTGIKIQHEANVDMEGNAASYGEMWEISRMSSMGVVKSKPIVREDIEEVIVEMNEKQPPFLRGQTTKAGINLSPVRVVKNPEGTLQRQALNAIQYAKERRQIREQQNKTEVRDIAKILDEVTPKQQFHRQPKRSAKTISSQKIMLPIHEYKEQLVKACFDNKVLIVIGQTGSGKTTQITQYLHEAGFSKTGKIGCTQPRRVAAMSVAKRVCEEMNVKLGEQVGYSIRFQDCTSSRTIIKYMTDGMLLRQALIDKYLKQYSVIMLDEAHERTIHTDVLFGILKKVIEKRNDFTLIVTSATLQAKKFSTYFFDCKIFSIPGRTYNVQILYAKQPETDYLDAALMCIMQIHLDEPPGDILLFLTGQQEIDTSCQILNERLRKMGSQIPELTILPVYSALPSELQTKIFQPAPKGKRKCVIATNIAEASLTIDGIFYVVDPGFAKVKIYNSKLGMDTLVIAPISQASAKQRAGRAGRTGPGKCYRLYTEEAYQIEMLPTSVPEIQRANLSNTVLELKAMGINDLINFDFMDAPPVQTLIVALQQLYYLSALDDEGLLTKLGRKMAQFPLEPPLSKMLLTSIDFGCSQEIITIISMLSVQNIFYRPKQKQVMADQKKTKFNHHEGDHLTFLSVYESWKNQGYSVNWCHDNYIQYRSLKRAQDVKKQIIQLLERYKFKITSCGGNSGLIRKTIVSGFFFHAAKKDPKGGYRTLVDDHQVYIHPSSSLFNKEPEWVVYHQLIFTTKEYMRDVCSINPKWLIDVAPNFFKFTDEIGFVRKKRNEKLDPLNQKYGDPNAWRLSKRKG